MVVDNDKQAACAGEDAALHMFIEAQRCWLETRSAADGEAAKQALRAVMMITGGNPEAAMPMHRWRHRQ